MVSFHLAGNPQPTSVRDPHTGFVVDGYRFTVISNDTGASAVLELTKANYTVEKVQEAADEALSVQDAVVGAFTKPRPE